MKIEQVAVQLYTLRDFLTTPEDYQESLQKVAEIGYKSVQVSGPRPIDESDIAALCAEKGLIINSSHEDSELILSDPAKVVENLEAFGCRYTAYPFPRGIDFSSSESVNRLITGLEEAGKVLSRAGKVLTYHNHAMELELLDGVPILEIIYGETDPKFLQGEIDTYWIHAGKSSPEAWCARLRDRLPLLHLKDYREDEDGTAHFAEIGNGILDFRTIIATAEASGCQWFIVEQDRCPGDPFDSLEMSFRYIRDNLVES
ncbi:MAG TPA: sugar phosphate isomerase/epimerase [Oceanipulchritudo sp.]|nr:sugar phosphate isomerase/epimerase [Oceanipulchritudo sp.]